MVPLGPVISRLPRTENTTAGSVGATAVATRSAKYQLIPNNTCRTTAAPAAVRNVPTTPTVMIGTAVARNLRHPMCIPPSKSTSTRATVMMRTTVDSGGADSGGITAVANAAPASTSSGAGILTRSVSRLAITATSPTALANRMISP